MSAQVLTDVRLLVGSVDMSPFTGEFTIAYVTTMKPARNFAGLGYEIVLPGASKADATLKGHADYAAGAVSAVFNSSSKGSQQLVGIHPTGSGAAVGDQCSFAEARMQSYKMLTGPVGEVADFEMAFTSDAAPVEGFVAAPFASRTTSGYTGTGVNIATGVPAGRSLYAGLWVTAAAGTNLAVKIQSDDNSGFTSATDRITFSTVSATGWQWGSVAGSAGLATETYWRCVATIASSTFTFGCALGVA